MGMHDRDYYKDWQKEKQRAELQGRLSKLKVQRRKVSPIVIAAFWVGVVLILTVLFRFFRHH